MIAHVLRNENLVIPFRSESEGVVGDSLIVISKKHPKYQVWKPFSVLATEEIEKLYANVAPWDGQEND